MTQSDKMLSRRDGQVGYLIFNNPERHNAVSLEMWEATARILDDFGKDDDIRIVVPHRQHQDRDAGEFAVGPHSLTNFQTADIRKVDIEDDHMRADGASLL